MNWRIFCIVLFSMFFLSTQGVYSHDNVVVIPLGGAAKGDAGAGDVLDGKTFSNASQKGVTGTRPAAPVAKTGHTTSIVDGDDGWYSSNIGVSVTGRFGAGVDWGIGLIDYLTGLYWESDPPVSTANWANAIARCEAKVTTLAHLTWDDWRLPTINEMHSIIDRTQINPALPPELNISLPANSVFWTSTPYWLYGTDAWTIDLATGKSETEDMAQPHYNFCVRGQFKFNLVFPMFDENKVE